MQPFRGGAVVAFLSFLFFSCLAQSRQSRQASVRYSRAVCEDVRLRQKHWPGSTARRATAELLGSELRLQRMRAEECGGQICCTKEIDYSAASIKQILGQESESRE
ncbi:hypothetical protein TRIATDRAFT_258992 [Trichoderma atroviride IMI 206040]|uniref:Hydrophobin n=1 Tax=Hypocrea atroviridis (strain ATCC 20476 / IMI 206040) TaxID=452589 RepID=G9P8E2_HYPAI|nr:uncharacterized protein TRIATDRAFT_258992 [Trichoderma atroviride IMI 206040]EHK40936.1 hypothetical protein TRIATDRAFT_258992 [Trichoderma atroviride IMI 206040]